MSGPVAPVAGTGTSRLEVAVDLLLKAVELLQGEIEEIRDEHTRDAGRTQEGGGHGDHTGDQPDRSGW